MSVRVSVRVGAMAKVRVRVRVRFELGVRLEEGGTSIQRSPASTAAFNLQPTFIARLVAALAMGPC